MAPRSATMGAKQTRQEFMGTERQGCGTDGAGGKRRYHSPLRQRQSADTRRRILLAGAELVHGFRSWDWTNLTARAVGDRAGVSERTVQRYFPTERLLRDAVLERLVEESGVRIDTLELADFAGHTARMFTYLASFATAPERIGDPSFESVDRQRRQALLAAVTRATPGWTDTDRESAAAALDILWNQPPYQRLVDEWDFDADRAVGLITWLIGLIEEAIREGRHP